MDPNVAERFKAFVAVVCTVLWFMRMLANNGCSDFEKSVPLARSLARSVE